MKYNPYEGEYHQVDTGGEQAGYDLILSSGHYVVLRCGNNVINVYSGNAGAAIEVMEERPDGTAVQLMRYETPNNNSGPGNLTSQVGVSPAVDKVVDDVNHNKVYGRQLVYETRSGERALAVSEYVEEWSGFRCGVFFTKGNGTTRDSYYQVWALYPMDHVNPQTLHRLEAFACGVDMMLDIREKEERNI